MIRLLIWVVKLVVGVAQFAFLSRLADRTGLRSTWVHPVAVALSRLTGLNEGFLEILVVASVSGWLVWVLSALCQCFTAALGRTIYANPETYRPDPTPSRPSR